MNVDNSSSVSLCKTTVLCIHAENPLVICNNSPFLDFVVLTAYMDSIAVTTIKN